MPCTQPMDAWRPRNADPGKASVIPDPGGKPPSQRPVFSPNRGLGDTHMRLPCGRCWGCLKDRTRDWGTRFVHEAQLHEPGQSHFVTLTYREADLPERGSVSVPDIQRFHKRLRKELGPFRFGLSSEYGPKTFRPHYHALYFGFELPDLAPVGRSNRGELLYRSMTFETIWGKGRCDIGLVTERSAGYVAGYINKKLGKASDDLAYSRIDADTGEVYGLRPEFFIMSRKPGIGFAWADRFPSDLASGFVIINGRKRPIPRAYLERMDEGEAEALRDKRKADGIERAQADAAAHASSGYGQARDLTRHQIGQLTSERFAREFEGVSQ